MTIVIIRASKGDEIEHHAGPGLANTIAIHNALFTALTLNPIILP